MVSKGFFNSKLLQPALVVAQIIVLIATVVIFLQYNKAKDEMTRETLNAPETQLPATQNEFQASDNSVSQREGITFDTMNATKTLIVGDLVEKDEKAQRIVLKTNKGLLTLQISDTTILGRNVRVENPEPGVLVRETSEPIDKASLYSLDVGTVLRVSYNENNDKIKQAEEITLL